MCSYYLPGQGKNRFPVCKRNMFLGGPHFCSLPSSVFHMDTLLNVVVTCMPSCFSCVQPFATLWTITHQTPLSIKLPGKNTGVGCHFLLQETFPTQGSNLCLLRLLHWHVPWTARRSNQSILEEINLESSLEWLMLKLQYFGCLMQRADSLEKTLMLGKIEGKERRGQNRMRWFDSITYSMDMNLNKLQRSLACCSPWGCKDLDISD